MNALKLTHFDAAAKSDRISESQGVRGFEMGNRIILRGFAGLLALALGGCVNVAAPEEPIVIELNVNIEARLLVELAEDANNTIDENADIF